MLTGHTLRFDGVRIDPENESDLETVNGFFIGFEELEKTNGHG